MVLEDLIQRILNNTGIIEIELTESVAQEIVDRSLSCLNNYYPMVLRGSAGTSVLRSYEDEFRTGYSDPYGLGLWEIGAMDWTLDNLDSDPSLRNDYYDLAIAYAKIMVGEKRRSIKFTGLPYDLNGDAMVTEGQALLDKMILAFTNRFPNAV